MRTVLGSLKQLVTYAVLMVLFYLWQVQHVPGTGNVFLFAVWLVMVLSFGVLLLPLDQLRGAVNNRSRFSAVIGRLWSTALVGALVWTGCFVTAVCYTVVWALLFLRTESLRDKTPAAVA